MPERHPTPAPRHQGEGSLAPPPLGSAERSPSLRGHSAVASRQRTLEARSAHSKLGEDEVTRPDGKVIKGSAARWGKRAEEGFLTELTVSGNVRHSAQAAGFSTTAIYKRRLKDRRFAAAWDAAVETGKARVQAYLVEAATRTFDPDELPIAEERELPKVSISEAINIAKLKPGPAISAGSGPSTSLGTDGAGDGGQWVTEEEALAARERIVERLEWLKERLEELPKCPTCGQPIEGDEGAVTRARRVGAVLFG